MNFKSHLNGSAINLNSPGVIIISILMKNKHSSPWMIKKALKFYLRNFICKSPLAQNGDLSL